MSRTVQVRRGPSSTAARARKPRATQKMERVSVKRAGSVVCGEGAKGCQQQRDPGGALPADLACQAGNEQAGNEIDDGLQIQHGAIVRQPEEGKTEGQKRGIAGEAHQRGLNGGKHRTRGPQSGRRCRG